jgi:hypothetical protein
MPTTPRAPSDACETDIYDFTNEDPQTAAIDLVDLKVWPPRQGERGRVFPIWPELRFAEEVIITESWRITVHLNRAELATRFQGCSIAPGTLYGDNPLETGEEITETEIGERDVSRSGEAYAGLSGDLTRGLNANGGLKINGKSVVRSKTEIKRKSKIAQERVITLPNQRWEIREPHGRLRMTYLSAPADEINTKMPLCRVIGASSSPTITLSLEARPRDIDPEIEALEGRVWLHWTSKPNKTKIAKLLISKACSERFVRPGDERITLARAVLRGKLKE